MEELLTLPGVGARRRTSSDPVARERDNICVDTHVHRISNRLGW
jgi:endonuclease-3